MKYFNQAIIKINNGTIIVDSTKSEYGDSHYNVTISNPNGEYIITGDLPKYGFSMDRNIDINLLHDNSIVSYKPLFKKRILRNKIGYLEYKERHKKTYTTNNLIIIE